MKPISVSVQAYNINQLWQPWAIPMVIIPHINFFFSSTAHVAYIYSLDCLYQ